MRKLKTLVRDSEVWADKHIKAFQKLMRGWKGSDGQNFIAVQAYLDSLPIQPIDPKNLDPMTRGYVKQALEEWVFEDYRISDIEPETLVQMSRDCVKFYWGSRHTFENIWADIWGEYTQKDAGRELWLSRNGSKGFIAHDDPWAIGGPTELWDQLHELALRLGPYHLTLNTKTGKLRGVKL